MFSFAGHAALYVTMAAVLALELVLAIDLQQPAVMLEAAAWILVLAILQYAAGRFLGALERLNRATPGRMNSTAFPDCFALLTAAAGLGALWIYSLAAIGQNELSLIVPAVVVFIFCQYAAIIALNPETLNLSISADAQAGEEALGLLAFLVKVGLRWVPVCFGLGVIWGMFLLFYATYLALAGDPNSLLAAPDGQAVFRQLGRFVLWFAASPVIMYFVFLLAHLSIDCLRALVSLPGKLDGLGRGKQKAEDETSL
jgi:hypothetical protein